MKCSFEDYKNTINESKKGNKYVSEILKRKKTVLTKVFLQKIRHNNSENDEICLKIGRYNISNTLVSTNPKSELTLSGEEFDNLIKFIEKYYRPMDLDINSFIPVNKNFGLNILTKFKDMSESDAEKAQIILESGVLNNNISSLIENTKRAKALEEYSKSLQEDKLESYWQDFFEVNKWILGSEFYKILDERRIDKNNISDFLVKSNDGFMDIVEIKRPNGINFWANSLDHDNYVPSSDLLKAIIQCQNYIYEIERESNSNKFLERVENTPVASPRCLLIIGRSKDWNQKQWLSFRLLNSSLNRISIMTYDQLFNRANKVLGNDNNDNH